MPQSMKSSVSVRSLACALVDRSLVDSVKIVCLPATFPASRRANDRGMSLLSFLRELVPSARWHDKWTDDIFVAASSCICRGIKEEYQLENEPYFD